MPRSQLVQISRQISPIRGCDNEDCSEKQTQQRFLDRGLQRVRDRIVGDAVGQ